MNSCPFKCSTLLNLVFNSESSKCGYITEPRHVKSLYFFLRSLSRAPLPHCLADGVWFYGRRARKVLWRWIHPLTSRGPRFPVLWLTLVAACPIARGPALQRPFHPPFLLLSPVPPAGSDRRPEPPPGPFPEGPYPGVGVQRNGLPARVFRKGRDLVI